MNARSKIPLTFTLILTFGLAMLTGCARTPPAPNAPTVAPSERSVARETSNMDPVPAGTLACKAKDAFGVVTEVYLEGRTGTVRRVTPSGMNEEERVEFERSGAVLIGDRPASDDLAVHAVTLREAGGKKYLRLGDRQESWSACL